MRRRIFARALLAPNGANGGDAPAPRWRLAGAPALDLVPLSAAKSEPTTFSGLINVHGIVSIWDPSGRPRAGGSRAGAVEALRGRGRGLGRRQR